ETGASVRDILGGSVILEATHAVAGTRYNIAWLVGSQVGAAATWENGYTYGGLDGPWPMASGATLEGTLPQTNCAADGRSCQMPAELATYGTHWGQVNFSQQSGYSFVGPGFAVDGIGEGTFNNK